MTKKQTVKLVVKKFVVPIAIVTVAVVIARALDNKTTAAVIEN